jgi:FkbM family methyltransferase
VAASLPSVLKTRNLGVADVRMGEGPYRVRLPGRPDRAVRLAGYKVIAHIRELWVRDAYGLADLPSGGTVLDLGANRGFFTAAAAGAGNRVIAVEPSRVGIDAIGELAKLNGWEGTVERCNAFVGGATPSQDDPVQIPDHEGVPFIGADELLGRYGIERIDFLKCDIEGSEFGLFMSDGRLLDLTQRLAMEVHYHAGNAADLIGRLQAKGFETTIQSESTGDCIVRAHRRMA